MVLIGIGNNAVNRTGLGYSCRVSLGTSGVKMRGGGYVLIP